MTCQRILCPSSSGVSDTSDPFPLVSSATLPFNWRALHSTRLLTPVWKTQPLSIFRFIDILTDFSNNFEGTLNWKIITRLIVSENEFTLYQSIALRQLYILTFGSETIGWSVRPQIDSERADGSARHLPPPSNSFRLRLNFHPDRVEPKKHLKAHQKSYRMNYLNIKFACKQ